MQWPGEGLLLKMWDTLAEKGIGSLLRPWQQLREGKAIADVRRYELLRIAQAERDAEDIRAGRKSFDLKGRLIELPALQNDHNVVDPPITIEPHPMNPALPELVSNNMVADAVRREVNLSHVIVRAEQELLNDPQEPSAKKIDDDWLYRWRDSASEVSSEELRDIWGRLLAGEVKSPGTFSLRTLDFLRNISKEEARNIAKLLRFVIGDFLYRGVEDVYDSEGIHFNFFLAMQELGVLIGVEAVGLQVTLRSLESDRFERGLISNGKVLVVSHEDSNKQIELPIYMLSKVGKQIASLGAFEPHVDYLHKTGLAIKNQGFRVMLADYKKLEGTRIIYFNSLEL